MRRLVERLGAELQPTVSRSVWTNVYGSARTLIALGSLGTLLFTSTTSMFTPAQGMPDSPYCSGVARASLFCLVPGDRLEVARWLSIAVLGLAASGWRPRWTAVPHWWVAFGLATTPTIPDGGDQIAMNMTLLLLPIALADGRRWHWDRGPAVVPAGRQLTSLVSWSAGLVIRLQVAGLYFQACVAKLSHDEWANGTALYYWMSDPLFGLPNWVRPVMEPILLSSVGVQAITWGALITEFCLFMGLTAKRSVRPWLLAAGFGLHLGIAVLMGLWSFSLAMMGCLVLYLRPLDLPWPAPGLVLARVSSLLRGRQRRTPVRAHSVLALERSDQA